MIKTTVYLPEAIKRKLVKTARILGTSEASLIRTAIERLITDQPSPRPRLPLLASNDPTLAERVDEELADFGS
ncbi:MAG: CopG family transcriptional regulator [Actinomycetota bacterium]